ncbi:hypothetical protein MMC16_000612 [Acarospora aff. strigata]|nr:hypothetical protein [Acarospora aff. strigata]
MEGGDQQRRPNDQSGYAARAFGQSTAQQQPGAAASDRYRQPVALASRDPTAAQSGGRSGNVQGYGSYGYTEPSQFGAPSLASSSMQYPSDYAQNSQRQPQQFTQYAPNIMYNVTQQPPPQSPYETVPQYQPRQSAAIEVLSTQFGVPQYYAPNEPTSAPGPAVPQAYAPAQFLTYPQQPSIGRPSLGQSYPTGMAEYAPQGASEVLEQQEVAQEPSSFDDAYNQYQNALRQTFENTRGGRLVEAGDSLLDISGWLLGHAEELGLVRDEQELHSDRIKLWDEFNTCWLAVLQKQKDMTQEMLDSGQAPRHPQSILQEDFMERMGRELVRLCDSMERHGLVDYQMGVWEEEIINVLTECLNLLDSDDEPPTIDTTMPPGPPAPGHSGR